MSRAANDKFQIKPTVITMVSLLLFADAVIGQVTVSNSINSTEEAQLTPAEQQQQLLLVSDANLFDQLNAFIQSRAKNVSEISENVFFKYYNR